MRLEEPIIAIGSFWIPGELERREPGTLRVSENGEATLEMMDSGSFGFQRHLSENNDNPMRILGTTEKGIVTLDNCKVTEASYGGLSPTRISVRFVYWGKHYDEDEDVSFSRVVISVEYLNKWLHSQYLERNKEPEGGGVQYTYYSGMSYHQLKNGGVSMTYIPPRNIPVKLHNGIIMRFWFSFQDTPNAFEASIKLTPYISFESTTKRPLDEFLSLVHRVCSFLSFSVDRAVSLESLAGYSDDLMVDRRGFKDYVPIEVHYRSGLESLLKSELNDSDIFLPYEAVEAQIDDVLNKWLECYRVDEFEPSLNLYSAVLSQPDIYWEAKFLFFAQSLEVLHRRVSDETAIPKDEFSSIRSAMLEVVPDCWRKHFSEKLGFANELSLKQRLDSLVAEFQEILGIECEERVSFVRKARDTRNYLTHYSKRLENKLGSDQELLDLTQQLKSLLQLHFLQLIGIDKPTITDLLECNSLYHERLKQLWQRK